MNLRHILIAAILLLASIGARAQTIGGGSMKVFAGVPSGPCLDPQQAINNLNGDFYTCFGGGWLKQTGNSNVISISGTANQITVTGTTNAVLSLPAAIITPGSLKMGGTLNTAQNAVVHELANDTSTGTIVNRVAILNGDNPAKAVNAGSAVLGTYGVVTGGAGTTGNVQIAVAGQALCTFDNTTTAKHFVQANGVDGKCHDSGATFPTVNDVVGYVIDGGAAGDHTVIVFGPGSKDVTSGIGTTTGSGTNPKLAIWVTSSSLGNIGTPTLCSLGLAPTGIDANGNATGCAAFGTVTTTGSPASGNLTKFSGTLSVTNGNLSNDVTTSGTLAATVVGINSTNLAGLATGILKNTTGTGVPSIAVAADFPSGISKTIASGTSTLATSAISSGTCATMVTTSATGVVTTDNIMADFNADPTGTTGYFPGAMLTIVKFPTANNVNFKACNNSASSITPGAVTLNWRVVR